MWDLGLGGIAALQTASELPQLKSTEVQVSNFPWEVNELRNVLLLRKAQPLGGKCHHVEIIPSTTDPDGQQSAMAFPNVPVNGKEEGAEAALYSDFVCGLDSGWVRLECGFDFVSHRASLRTLMVSLGLS